MQFSKQLSVVLAIAAVSFTSTSFGQQDDKALLQECLRAQAEEFLPLAEQRDEVYHKFSSRSTSVRSILTWLEDDYKTADAKRIQEIASLENRLKALKKYANLTSSEAIKDTAAAEEAAKKLLANIEDERDLAIKPFSRKLSALRRTYKARELNLNPVIMNLFREKGDSKSSASLKKSYGSFSYSSGTSSATYKREGKEASSAICYIYLFNDKVGKVRYGKFLDKYPIAYKNKNQLEVLVGETRVTINTAETKLGGNQIEETLSGLVDFEKFEALLAP